jgi:hypothetical protein
MCGQASPVSVALACKPAWHFLGPASRNFPENCATQSKHSGSQKLAVATAGFRKIPYSL